MLTKIRQEELEDFYQNYLTKDFKKEELPTIRTIGK